MNAATEGGGTMILQNWWYTTLLGTAEGMRPPLVGKTRADVVVVGAGAAGLAAALALAEAGRDVVLLERNICGGSSTGKSAGFLTPDSELELAQLVRRFGPDGARDLWDGAVRGVGLMVDAVGRHGIECDLVRQDSLFLGNGRAGWRAVEEEVEARATLGYDHAVYPAERLGEVVGSDAYSGAVRYTGTYGVNPLLYAQGVKRALVRMGVRVHEASEVTSIEGRTVRTHLGSVEADSIILCIDKPRPTLTRYARNVYHAQTFLSVSEPLDDEDVEAMFPAGPLQCWDTDLVYTYHRLTGDRRLLVGGGSKLTTFSRFDVTSPRVIERVIGRLKRRFPRIEHVGFVQYWPGRIDTTRDLLPTILHDPAAPHIHHVLGCVGLPWATFCGDFVARHILDDAACDDHRFYRFFSPGRRFALPLWLQDVVGKQVLFSLSNAHAKYRQVDGETPDPSAPSGL